MAPRAIISYDDTPGDHDALMLGRVLADAGASLTLTALDDELTSLWDAPVTTPSLRW